MTLATHEFIRRFLIHVLPSGFHRIRHYGLFANGCRAANIARARELLNVLAPKHGVPGLASTIKPPHHRSPPHAARSMPQLFYADARLSWCGSIEAAC
jgi:hypothetical protein